MNQNKMPEKFDHALPSTLHTNLLRVLHNHVQSSETILFRGAEKCLEVYEPAKRELAANQLSTQHATAEQSLGEPTKDRRYRNMQTSKNRPWWGGGAAQWKKQNIIVSNAVTGPSHPSQSKKRLEHPTDPGQSLGNRIKSLSGDQAHDATLPDAPIIPVNSKDLKNPESPSKFVLPPSRPSPSGTPPPVASRPKVKGPTFGQLAEWRRERHAAWKKTVEEGMSQCSMR